MDSLHKSGDKNSSLSSSKQDWKKCIAPVKSSPPELVHYLTDQSSPKTNNGNSPPQLLPEVIVTRNKITKIAATPSKSDDNKSTQLKASRNCVRALHKGKQKYTKNSLLHNKNFNSISSKSAEGINTTIEIPCAANKDLYEVNKETVIRETSCRTPTLVAGFKGIGKITNETRNSEYHGSVNECIDKSVNTDIMCGPNFSKSHLLKGKESFVNTSIANYSETSSDVPEYDPLDLEASWSEDDMFEGYFKIANCVSTGKEERDTIDGYEFLSFETEHDMVEFTKIELDFKGISLLDDNLAQSDDGLDLMYEAYGDSESQSVSQAIVPTKTKDITKIKGWRTKQFLVNYNPSHSNNSNIACDEEDDGFVSCDIKIEEESNIEQSDKELVREEQPQTEQCVIKEKDKFEDIFNLPSSSMGVQEDITRTVSPLLQSTDTATGTESLTKTVEITSDQQLEETVSKCNHAAKPIFLSNALNSISTINSDKISSQLTETHTKRTVGFKPDERINSSLVEQEENIKSSQSKIGPKTKTLSEKRKLLKSVAHHEIRKGKIDETCNLEDKAIVLQPVKNNMKQNMKSINCLETRKKTVDLSEKHICRTPSPGEHLKLHTDKNLKFVSTLGRKGNICISKDLAENILCIPNATNTICLDSKNNKYNESCEKGGVKLDSYLDQRKVSSQIIKDKSANYGISFYSGVGKPLARRIVAHLDRIRFNVYDIDNNWANFAASVILPKNWKPESLPKNHIILPVKENNFYITDVSHEIQRPSLDKPMLKTDNTSENLNSTVSEDLKIEIPAEIKPIIQDIISYIELKEQGDFVTNDPDEPSNLKANATYPSLQYGEQNDNAYNVTKIKPFKRRKTVMFRELRRLDVNYIEMNSDNSKMDSIDNINVNCSEVYCKLGCVCKSLLFCKPLSEHCGLVDCMFQCTCKTPICPKDENPRPSLLFPRTVLRLQAESGRSLAKEEREFQHTVIQGKEGVIVVGGDGNVRKKREIKLPGRLRDSIFCSEFSIQDFKLNLSEEERFIAKKSLNSKLSLQATNKKQISNKVIKSEKLSPENQSSKGWDPARRQTTLLPKRKLEEDNYVVTKRSCLLPTSSVGEKKKVSPLKLLDFKKSTMENFNKVEKIDSVDSNDMKLGLQQQVNFQKCGDDNTSQDVTMNEYSDLLKLFGIEQCYVSLNKLKGRPHKHPFCMNHLKYNCHCIQRSKTSSPTPLCKLIDINTVIKKMSEPTETKRYRGLLTKQKIRNVARKSTTTVKKLINSKFNVKPISIEGLCQEITPEKSNHKGLLSNKNSDEIHQGIKIAGVTSLSLEEFARQEKLDDISKSVCNTSIAHESLATHNLNKHEEKSVIYEPKLLVSDMKGKKHESDHMSLVVNLLKTHETELKMLLANSYNRPDLRQRHKSSLQVLNWSVLKDLFFKDIVFVWLKNLNGRGKVIITDSNVKPHPHFLNIKNLLDHDQAKPVVVDLLMSPIDDGEKSRFGILICDGFFWEIAGTLIRQDWANDKPSLVTRNSDRLSQGGEYSNKCSITDKKINDLPHMKTPTSVSPTKMENVISELLDLREDLKLKLEIVNVFITDETDNVSNFHITDSSDLKWFGVPFGNKYYIIYIESRKCVIKYKEVANVLFRCIKNKASYCIPLLSSDSLIDVRCMTAPLFGIYTHYKFPNKIFIGPFSPNENPGINVLRVTNVSVDPSTSSINENSSRPKSSDQVSLCAFSSETQRIITRLLNLPVGSDLSLQVIVINVTEEISNIDKFQIPNFGNHQWFGIPFNKSYHLIYIESMKCIVRHKNICSIMNRSRRNKTTYCIPLLESNIPIDVSALKYPIFGVYANFTVPCKIIIGPFINTESHGICAFKITNDSINLENIFQTYKGTFNPKSFVLEDTEQSDQKNSDLCNTDSKSEDEEQTTLTDSPKAIKKQGLRKVPSLWNILTKDFNLQPSARKVSCWLVPTIQNIGYISATYSKDRRLIFKHPSNNLREILTFTTVAAADKWLNKYLQSRIRFVPKHLTIFWQVRPLNYDLDGLKPFDPQILKGNYGLTYCGPFDIRHVKVSKAKQFGLKPDDVHRLQEKLRRRDILDGFRRLENILLAGDRKQMSRIRILKASIVVINTLKRQSDKLMEVDHRLREEKQKLLQKLYKLMTNMKHEAVVQDVVTKLQKVWTAKDVPLVQIDDEDIEVDVEGDDEVSSHSSNSISIDNTESKKNLIDIVSSDSDLDDYLSDDEENILFRSGSTSDVSSGFIDHSVEDSSKIDDSVSMSISVVQDSDSQDSFPRLESNDEIVIEKCSDKENLASDSKPKFILRDIESLKKKVVIANPVSSVTRTGNILPSITQKIKNSLHNSTTTTLNNQLIISRSKLNDMDVDPLALSSSFENIYYKSVSNKGIECIEISDSDSEGDENKLEERLSSSANNVSTNFLKAALMTEEESSAFSVEAKDPLEIAKASKVYDSPPIKVTPTSANQSKLFVKLLPKSNIPSPVSLTKSEKTIAQFPKLKVTPTSVQNSGVQYVFKRGNKVYVKTESGKPIPVVMQPNHNKKSLLNSAFRSSAFDTIVSRDATNRSILISNNLTPNNVKSFTTIPVTPQIDVSQPMNLQANKVHPSDLDKLDCHSSCDTAAIFQSTSSGNEPCISVTKVGSLKQSEVTSNSVLTPSLILSDVKTLGKLK